MNFNREKIMNRNVYVHCETYEQTRQLLDWAHSIGQTWGNGTSFKDVCYHHMYYASTHTGCYNVYKGVHGSFGHLEICIAEGDDYIIYNFNEVVMYEVVMYELEYKAIKTISAKTIFDCNPCATEFSNFIIQYGYDEIEWTIEIENKFSHENGWIEFLVENNFIIKIIDIDNNLKEIKKLKSEIEERENRIKELEQKLPIVKVSDPSWMCEASNPSSAIPWVNRPRKVVIVENVHVKNEFKRLNDDYKRFEYYDVKVMCPTTKKYYYTFSHCLRN